MDASKQRKAFCHLRSHHDPWRTGHAGKILNRIFGQIAHVVHPGDSAPRPARRTSLAFLLFAATGSVCLLLPSVNAQSTYKEPDYSKLKPESGPITLEVWSWVIGFDKAAKLFEQAYPDIKVNVNNVGVGPAEYQKLQTAIKAGSGGPDVAQIEYDFLPSFIVADGIADISKFVSDDVKSYFVPWTWGQVSPDGKAVYGVPLDSGPLAFLYNKKIFDEYGLTVPTTWDEFAQQAAKLAQASGGKVYMVNFPPTHAPWLIALAWADGAQLFKAQGDSWTQSLNNPACEKVLTYWAELVNKKYAATITDFTPEFYNAVASGQIASLIEAAWGPGVLAASVNDKSSGEWRVAPLPQWSKDQAFRAGNWGGSCDAVLKQSKHPNAATLFCVWLNSAKGAVLSNWNNCGIFPAALSGLGSPELNQPEKNPSKFCGGQNVAEVYIEASKAVDVDFPWSPWFAFVNDDYNKQIAALFSGAMTPKQALEAWQNDCLKNATRDGYDVKAR
jgi:multiple sugar transport system substrate-binding protein